MKMTPFFSRVHLIFTLTMATAAAFLQDKKVEIYSKRRISLALRNASLESFTSRRQYHKSINVTLEDQREILKSRIPAPIEDRMSKYQIEFRELLTGILYTEKEVQTVLNPRLRTVLKGIAASYYDPDVYRAFEILYEDYAPLRIAGRVVYRELTKVVDESKQYQQSQIDSIIKVTGMTRSEIEDCWSDFSELTSVRMISFSELEKCMRPQTFQLVLNRRGVSQGTEVGEKGGLSFEQLLIRLHECSMDDGDTGRNRSRTSSCTENASAQNILQHVLEPSHVIYKRKLEEQCLSPKQQKFNHRYDAMLVQFSKWKPLIPSGDGRRLQILRGCFVGSENSAVVEALRVIYVDYAALRISGDWIFKVVSTVMGPIVRRHDRRERKSLQS